MSSKNPDADSLDEEARALFLRRIQLRGELNEIERKLQRPIENMKDYMAGDGLRIIETQGLRISYSSPVPYWRLKESPKKLKDIYPNLFERRIGYERLVVRTTNYAGTSVKTISTYDQPIDRAALLDREEDFDDVYDFLKVDINDAI